MPLVAVPCANMSRCFCFDCQLQIDLKTQKSILTKTFELSNQPYSDLQKSSSSVETSQNFKLGRKLLPIQTDTTAANFEQIAMWEKLKVSSEASKLSEVRVARTTWRIRHSQTSHSRRSHHSFLESFCHVYSLIIFIC